MPDKISVREDLQVILVESTGEITIEDLRGTLRAGQKIRQDTGLTNVLVDAREVTSFPSTFPVFEFAEELVSVMRDVRLALVPSPAANYQVSFLETVATNRMAQVKVFEDIEAALAWLVDD